MPKYWKNPLKEYAAIAYTRLLDHILQPDFTITLDHTIARRSQKPSYTFITLEDTFVQRDVCQEGSADTIGTSLTPSGENVLTYDGFINGDITHGNIRELLNHCHQQGRCTKLLAYGVPTSYGPLYEPDPRILASSKLFYCGANWDPSRTSEQFQTLFKILEERGDLVVYGQADKWPFLTHSFKWFLPFDGVSFLNKVHEAGIALCFHSEGHKRAGIPSARVFETLAAGAMPIVDLHPQIQSMFGETLLYVDTSLPPKELAAAILAHQQWVHSHPQEAARRILEAQNIFAETFSIEALLSKLFKKVSGRSKQTHF